MARQRVYIGTGPSADTAEPDPLQPVHSPAAPIPRPSFPRGDVYAVPLGVWPIAIPEPAPGFDLPFTLKQTGDIPADAQSLHFLYQGDNLKVFIGGALKPMNFIGTRPTDNPAAPTAPYFAVDVSPFAGMTAELRFEFRSYGFDDFSGGNRFPGEPDAKSHVLDDLKFSALPASVPEPGTYALFALGFAALACHLRRQRPR